MIDYTSEANFMSKDYTAKDIQVLEGLEAVRKRPGMYVGSTGLSGLHQIAYEVIDNAVDEHVAGFCKNIHITLHENHSITVEDDGRGIPVDLHKGQNMSALEVVLTKLHAGGKFDDKTYKNSSGLHGVGVSATNALSKKLTATVYRNKKVYQQTFEKGITASELKEIGKTTKTGTIIHFVPDTTIFTESQFKQKILCSRFKELAFLNAGLTIYFKDEINKTDTEFHYAKGLFEFIEELNQSKEVLHDPIYICHEGDFNFELIFQYNSGYTDHIYSFANNINTIEGGTHVNGVKSALLKYMKEYIDKNKLLKGTSLEILPKDILEGLTLIINLKLLNPEFESQTKIKLNNVEIRQPIEEIILAKLEKIKLAPVVFEKIVNSIKVRDAAKKARKLIKRKGLLDTTLPGKLADCTETDPEKCELMIVEGSSAAGSVKLARIKDTQAVLALKGKFLNVEKTSFNRMLENEEIKNIITTLGTGISKEGIDLEKLRYHKIIIMTDADVDGGHICSLLLTLFFKYMRQIIDHGHLYIAVSPLFRVKWKTESKYFITEEELEKYIEKKSGYVIQRFKGLGEMNPDQLEETVLNPDKRQLIQVEISSIDEAENLFDILMGNRADARKKFISENAEGFELLE